jgi:hypothetical protein
MRSGRSNLRLYLESHYVHLRLNTLFCVCVCLWFSLFYWIYSFFLCTSSTAIRPDGGLSANVRTPFCGVNRSNMHLILIRFAVFGCERRETREGEACGLLIRGIGRVKWPRTREACVPETYLRPPPPPFREQYQRQRSVCVFIKRTKRSRTLKLPCRKHSLSHAPLPVMILALTGSTVH